MNFIPSDLKDDTLRQHITWLSRSAWLTLRSSGRLHLLVGLIVARHRQSNASMAACSSGKTTSSLRVGMLILLERSRVDAAR